MGIKGYLLFYLNIIKKNKFLFSSDSDIKFNKFT